jgi:hypothetical protein
MTAYSAIVLICHLSVAPSECTETNAVDVIARHVQSEIASTQGWQEIIARGGLREGLGEQFYVKTRCQPLPAEAK